MTKTFRDLINSEKRFIGTYVMSPCDADLEVMKMAGVDFVILELEHERMTFTEIMPTVRICEACDLVAMVRVPELNETMIKKVLDIGVSAVKIPDIENADQARRAVAFSKYPPEGLRGSCPFVRCNNYATGDRSACYAKANMETVVSVIIESMEGIKNMEEIVAVPGIDTISIGNIDLSMALGVPGQVFHPKVLEIVLKCGELCEAYGKCCSAQVVTPEDVKRFARCKGITHFHVDTPPTMLYKAYKVLCEKSRENFYPQISALMSQK